MRIELTYFDGCPNWRVMYERLVEALAETGQSGTPIHLLEVTTEQQASAIGFAGSPTVLVDGTDPFADERPGSGLTCRLYVTPEGVGGAPTVAQLVAAINDVRAPR